MEYLGRLAEKSLAVKLIDLFAEGDTVVALTEVSAGGETGRDADVFTVRNGKTVRAVMHGDTAMMERVYGKKALDRRITRPHGRSDRSSAMSVSSWHATTSLACGRDRRWTARHRVRLEPAGAVADEHAGLRAGGCAEPRHSHAGIGKLPRRTVAGNVSRPHARLPAQLGGRHRRRRVGQPHAGVVLRPQQAARPADTRAAVLHQRHLHGQ